LGNATVCGARASAGVKDTERNKAGVGGAKGRGKLLRADKKKPAKK